MAMRMQHSRRATRSSKGILGMLLMSTGIMITLMLGIVALDVAHIISVTTELQNATDAAALAGARDIDISDELAEQHALEVAAENQVDGRQLSNDVPGRSVLVKVRPTSRSSPGLVQVMSSVTVYHLLAPLLGRKADIVSANSVAGPSGTINGLKANQTFPIAVSIDAIPRNGSSEEKSLNRLRLTDTLTLYIDAQDAKNAAFTSFAEEPYEYDHLRNVIDQALGVPSSDAEPIPPVRIGDKLRLSDGIVGQRHLMGSAQYNALLSQPMAIFPVIDGYPQQHNEAAVVGFIGARIVSATIDYERNVVDTLKIKIIKNAPPVKSGEIRATGDEINDSALNALSPGALKLLPAVRGADAIEAMTGTSAVSLSRAKAVSPQLHRQFSATPKSAFYTTTAIVMEDAQERSEGWRATGGVGTTINSQAPSTGLQSLIGTSRQTASDIYNSAWMGSTSIWSSSPEDAPATNVLRADKSGGLPGIDEAGPAGHALRNSSAQLSVSKSTADKDRSTLAPAVLRGDYEWRRQWVTWEMLAVFWSLIGIALAVRGSKREKGETRDLQNVPPAPPEPMYPIVRARLERMRAWHQLAVIARQSRSSGLWNKLCSARRPQGLCRFARKRSKLYWQSSPRVPTCPSKNLGTFLDLQLILWQSSTARVWRAFATRRDGD
jgi:Flp pilus assembly protein TadG